MCQVEVLAVAEHDEENARWCSGKRPGMRDLEGHIPIVVSHPFFLSLVHIVYSVSVLGLRETPLGSTLLFSKPETDISQCLASYSGISSDMRHARHARCAQSQMISCSSATRQGRPGADSVYIPSTHISSLSCYTKH
jgi:hypothetical protein